MSEQPKSKLIIDKDWKTQVEREREQLKQHATPEGAKSKATGPAEPPSSDELPPASFSTLVQMLATQAMAAMGLLYDPNQGEPRSDPALAHHFIDLLGMLEEKTKGHLSPEEQGFISQALHELRMLYVSLAKE